jgi:hypothetical protein
MGILTGKAIIVTAPVGIGHATSLVLLAESASVSNHKLACQVQSKMCGLQTPGVSLKLMVHACEGGACNHATAVRGAMPMTWFRGSPERLSSRPASMDATRGRIYLLLRS